MWGEGCPLDQAEWSKGLCHGFSSCWNIWMCSACLIGMEQSWTLFFMPVEGKPSGVLLRVQRTGHAGQPGPRGGEGRSLTAKKCMEMMCAGAGWGWGGCGVICKQVWAQPRPTNLLVLRKHILGMLMLLYIETVNVFLELNP